METIQDYIAAFSQLWQQAEPQFVLLFALLFLLIWFLPTLLALIFNRQHLVKIALLNIPAGVSWVAWAALCIWAVTGRLSASLAAKAKFSASKLEASQEVRS